LTLRAEISLGPTFWTKKGGGAQGNLPAGWWAPDVKGTAKFKIHPANTLTTSRASQTYGGCHELGTQKTFCETHINLYNTKEKPMR